MRFHRQSGAQQPLTPFQAIRLQARDLWRTIVIAVARPYEMRAALR